MLWTLILTTVISGAYVEIAPITSEHVSGFASEADCVYAGKLMGGKGITNIGRYNDYTFTSYQCVPMGVKK